MRLRITPTKNGDSLFVQVDGWLTGEGGTELEKVCRWAEGPLVLRLTELRFADSDGIETIRRLVKKGAKTEDVPPYIQLLLE